MGSRCRTVALALGLALLGGSLPVNAQSRGQSRGAPLSLLRRDRTSNARTTAAPRAPRPAPRAEQRGRATLRRPAETRQVAPRNVRPGVLRRNAPVLAEAIAQVRRDASSGQVSRAAQGFLALRRQLGFWAARKLRRQVTASARRLANERSLAADVEGSRDAVLASRMLREAGELGIFARWRARRAERRVLRRSMDALRNGELDRSLDHLGLVAELRGPSSRRTYREADRLYTRSLDIARTLSRHGDTEGTMRAIEVAGTLAPRLGLESRLQERAETLMTTAVTNALPLMTRRAADLHHARMPEDAAEVLFAVLEMQTATGIAPSRRVAREQARLSTLMGPRLARLGARRAQQVAAESAQPTEPAAAEETASQ